MNDSENFSSELSSAGQTESQAYESLRKIVLATLVALLILGGSINIFLLRQMVFMRKDLDAVRPQVKQLMENYQKIEEPQIKSFVNALANFGRTHPDFQTILAKYKIAPQAQVATPPTGVPAATNSKK